jgi:hypothetical protein
VAHKHGRPEGQTNTALESLVLIFYNHTHHEIEEEPLIHFEGIKSEEVYLDEGG